MSHVIFEYSPELASRISEAVHAVLNDDIRLAAVYAGVSEDLMKQIVDDQWAGGKHFVVQSRFLDACCCTERFLRTGEAEYPVVPPMTRLLKRKDDTIEVFLRAGVMERGDIMTVQRYNAARGENTPFPDSFWNLWNHIGNTAVFHGRL